MRPTSESYNSPLNTLLERINYSYKERYNGTVTFRADGSSRFSKGHQWGYFPSAGLSWNIDKEPFIHFNQNISYLKLRASYGRVGNQEIGDFQYISNIVPETYYFNDIPVTAYVIDNLSNPELKWETTTSYNVGLNAGFFDNRLNITFDAYYKKTNDLLLNVPVESVTGFSQALRNIGSVSNKGLELEVGGVIIDNKNLRSEERRVGKEGRL